MTTDRRYNQIWDSLKDPEYRKQFIDENINVGIAFQINGIRERQHMTQKELAVLLGDKKKQPMISAWEKPSYGKYTLKTLKDLAKKFDVGLLVRFVPFSKMVEWTINVDNDVIAPPNFIEECSYTTVTDTRESEFSGVINDINTAMEFHVASPSDIQYFISAMDCSSNRGKEPIHA